jgi:hypothetical protein
MSARADSIELGAQKPYGATPSAAQPIGRRWLGLDPFELAVLAGFGLVSLWTMGIDLWRVVAQGRAWTGTDGLFLTDQMQYLAWIQSASQHILVSDLFVLHDTPRDYLQPLVVVSGILTRLGVAAWVALLVWKPVAVLAMFIAARAFVNASLRERGARRAALVIALFGGSLPAIGDLWPGFWTWGYSYPLIGIAALPAALVTYAAARDGRLMWWIPACLGLLAGWLHPWQGETLILILLGTEAVIWFRGGRELTSRRRRRLLTVTLVASLIPLLYYIVLARADPQWGMARVASKHAYELPTLALALAPLLLASAPAYGHWPHRFLPTATRLWLPVALIVFVVSESGLSATPLHAFAGITVPLGVLSVEGVMSFAGARLHRHRIVGLLLVAAVTVPATVAQLHTAAEYLVPSPANANFIAHAERRAFNYLDHDPEPGGVLTRGYLGLITPAITGRHTYLGGCQWSEPACPKREQLVHRVFEGPTPVRVIRSDVLGTRARFVLNSTCVLPGKDLDDALAPIASAEVRFGCATLYVIRNPRS